MLGSVHTHLLPPEHGKLMLWGIDELLTYHYLVAEFFQTAPLSLSNDSFFALNKVLGLLKEIPELFPCTLAIYILFILHLFLPDVLLLS